MLLPLNQDTDITRHQMRREESSRSLVIFGVIQLFIFLCLLTVTAQLFYPATGELEHYVSLQILNGHMPYRDFAFEAVHLMALIPSK